MRPLSAASPMLAALLAALLPALLPVGCAAPPATDLPPDVPSPSRVRRVEADGFRLFIDAACLSRSEERALLAELRDARRRLLEILGPHAAPGDFRPFGQPRDACPPAAAPSPTGPIDVVVVRGGDRCHADGDGITLMRDHLARRDATHELVHYLAGSSWRPIDEGLAVYLTERLWGPDKGIPVKVRARAFLDLSLDVDLDPLELREGMSRRDYDVGGAFVGWLLEAYGAERFWRLYAGPLRNYHGVYGVSEAELWQRFWRYVGNLDVRHSSAYHAFRAQLTGR